MTTSQHTPALDLLQQGAAALAAGDSFSARARFRAAAEQDPACAEAWFALGTLTPALRDRKAHLQRALALRPDHAEAVRQLAEVEALLARGVHIQKIGAPKPPAAAATGAPLLTGTAAPRATVAPAPPVDDIGPTTACFRHPERVTGLRCASCEQPICTTCASLAPVGHLCSECRKTRRPVNYQVHPAHLLVAAAVCGLGGLLAAALGSLVVVGFLGFYIAMAVAPFVGAGLVLLIDRLTRGKRGRPMQIAAGAAVVAGMLPVVLFGRVLLMLAQVGFAAGALAPVLEAEGLTLWTLALSGVDPAMAIFMGLTAISAMYRLR